ncbi:MULTISPECIES: hypothetical protein [Aneurinibacillus]|nr:MULTISPECIES: hypothetical protein [Aneurinibacillus]MED0679097.1 hypothetical protein [Aneurinibacillus thermoaerophilus]
MEEAILGILNRHFAKEYFPVGESTFFIPSKLQCNWREQHGKIEW